MSNDMILYQSVITDIRNIIAAGRESAYSAASTAMIMTYWNIGKRIIEQEQAGEDRAEYGKHLIAALSDELTKEFGKGFSERNLHYYRKFYSYFPDEAILNACVQNLNWTHLRSLLRVSDENARIWYLNEAAKENWSSRTLDRNISTQYYYRLLQTPQKEAVIAEMQEKTKAYQKSGFELIKSPVVAEFLGFKNEDTFLESDLESAILSHIRDLSYSQFSRVWHYITVRTVKERKIYRYINGEKIHHTISPKLGERCRTDKSIYYTLDFDVTPHLLRHTYITNLIHEGVDPKTVQYLAGHENSKVTMDIYAKVKYNKPWELASVVNQAFEPHDNVEKSVN